MSSPVSSAPSEFTTTPIGVDHPSYRHLLAARKAPQLSELTLGLLHKFNNLYTGIMFLTEESMSRAEAGENVADRLQEILTTLRDSHSYIDRVTKLHLDESEDDAGYHELDVVIAQHLDLARLLLPRGTAFTHHPAEERLTFYASQRALLEIVLHVVANAGEAIPKRGGSVTITSRQHPGDDTLVQVEVRDNGPGFSPEVTNHLFVSLCTTKDPARHAGLDLLRCRELARTFGGDLAVHNHPEGGGVVTLTLPRDNNTPNED